MQIASNLAGMLLFGGGESMLGLGIANAHLMASLTRSDSKILIQAAMRSMDGQPASMHVGQKYPILTAGYFGPASFSGPNAYMPPPSFTFEDLGFGLKATPHVHGTEEVTLAIEAEFKVLSGTANNGIPIISNRSLKSDVTLKMGEWAVVAGLMEAQDARTLSGIAGLARIPLLGPLTRSNTRDKESQEVLILLSPKLLTQPPDQGNTHVFRMGSETRPLTPL
jgi:general secretion pathway protein D